MPNINDYIGPDGCDLDYKGSDHEQREDDESFVNTRFTNSDFGCSGCSLTIGSIGILLF